MKALKPRQVPILTAAPGRTSDPFRMPRAPNTEQAYTSSLPYIHPPHNSRRHRPRLLLLLLFLRHLQFDIAIGVDVGCS